MEGLKPAISLSDNALKHLSKMRSERGEDLCLRIGVKQGGCSGISYTMDFENRVNARPDYSTIEYEGFTIVCDPESMVFLFGMQLDYSDALIGGGFSFSNPNATQTLWRDGMKGTKEVAKRRRQLIVEGIGGLVLGAAQAAVSEPLANRLLL